MYSAYKLKKGAWVPAKLRITSFAVEKVDSQGEQASSGSRYAGLAKLWQAPSIASARESRSL